MDRRQGASAVWVHQMVYLWALMNFFHSAAWFVDPSRRGPVLGFGECLHDELAQLVRERRERGAPLRDDAELAGDARVAQGNQFEAALVDRVEGEAGNNGECYTGPNQGDRRLNVLDFEAPAQCLPAASERIVDDDSIACLGADPD